VPEVVSLLKPHQNKNIIVVVGGVIPASDYEFLYNAGVQAIFGPGTKISQSAIELLDFLLDTEMKPIESLAVGV
jgi:methylmalonyl-CoA mutase